MTDITELAPAMKAAAENASGGDWVKESGDGWDATCSNDDQANSGFIIAHFEGPDAAANREFVQAANPANILALVEALEKAQQHIARQEQIILNQDESLSIRRGELEKAQKSKEFLKGQLSEFANFNPDWDKLEASYDSWREVAAELLVAKDRIAELESRTVTIEPFRSFVTDADLVALHRFAECCDDPESGGHDLEKEQVRRLEAIGALQRSGRVSYITGFGDVLISITSGIKWEAE